MLIVRKEILAPAICRMEIAAPAVARKAAAGQFVILRLREGGERIPLTIADFDRAAGTVTIVFQAVGKTTGQLLEMEAGEEIANFVGPLGQATEVEKFGRVAVVGGGVGIAPIYPIARAMYEAGNTVTTIIGARNRELLFYTEELAAVSHELLIATDDGSAGRHGLVTAILQDRINEGANFARVVAVGPVPMMRAVAELTRPYGLKTIVSLNPIMVDGTGMCGACRVSVGGVTKFACVDGPDFDGHLVNFAELSTRQRMYRDQEQQSVHEHEHEHGGECRCR